MVEFCECGSIKINGKCSNKNCPEKRSRRKVWSIKGIVFDFGKPVTYTEAYISAEKILALQDEIKHELRK
jgi:hypothetical protein